jgi:hypothetical protein
MPEVLTLIKWLKAHIPPEDLNPERWESLFLCAKNEGSVLVALQYLFCFVCGFLLRVICSHFNTMAINLFVQFNQLKNEPMYYLAA